jgi:hypothetical protein
VLLATVMPILLHARYTMNLLLPSTAAFSVASKLSGCLSNQSPTLHLFLTFSVLSMVSSSLMVSTSLLDRGGLKLCRVCRTGGQCI